MALLDMRGVLRRCPECDTAVAEDARRCVACGATLEEASRKPGGNLTGKKATPGAAPPRAVLGPAGFPFMGMGAGSGRVSAALADQAERMQQVLGEALVK